jgi:hypothetical protein
VPSPVRDHPSQPYSPFRPPAPEAPPPPPKKSRKGLVIGLVAGVLAVVGGVVVVVVVRGGGASRSRDAVIKETFAALAKGDEDALFALANPAKNFEKISRCEKKTSDLDKDDLGIDGEFRKRITREEADYRDPKKIDERWRKDVKQLLRRTKGTKLEVVDILTEMPPKFGTKPATSKRDDDDDDRKKDRDYDRYKDDEEDRPEHDKQYKLTTYRKGQEVARGCYARVPFRRQQVKVAVDVKDGDREFTQRVKVNLQEIDGNWYLAFPPSLNVGFDVVTTDLQEWRDKTCKCTDAACIEDLDVENGRLSYVQYEMDRDSDLPKEVVVRIEEIQRERRVCEATARGGPEMKRYKELKDQLCACKDEECGRKLELEMGELRRQVETNVRRQRSPSYEVTRQLSDVALAASECSRKLAQLKPRIYSAYPTSGETTGGAAVIIRGGGFTVVPRTAKVFFGTKEATVVRIASDLEIVVEAPPADAEGFVDIRLEFTPGGSLTVPYGFTYRAPPKPVKPTKPTKPKPKPPADDNPF